MVHCDGVGGGELGFLTDLSTDSRPVPEGTVLLKYGTYSPTDARTASRRAVPVLVLLLVS